MEIDEHSWGWWTLGLLTEGGGTTNVVHLGRIAVSLILDDQDRVLMLCTTS